MNVRRRRVAALAVGVGTALGVATTAGCDWAPSRDEPGTVVERRAGELPEPVTGNEPPYETSALLIRPDDGDQVFTKAFGSDVNTRRCVAGSHFPECLGGTK